MSKRSPESSRRPPAKKAGSSTRQAAHIKAAEAAGTDAQAYRQHLLDRLRYITVKFDPMGLKMALAELKEFSHQICTDPRMRGYFNPPHLTDLLAFPDLAEMAMGPLSVGGMLVEVLALPETHDRTQIRQTVTGDTVLRASYYFKRGYNPADCKPLADELLTGLLKRGRGSLLTNRQFREPFKQTNEAGWIYPVA